MNNEQAQRVIRIYDATRIILLILLFLFICVGLLRAETSNDFGLWTSANFDKSLGKRWNIGAGLEVRTKDLSQHIDRCQIIVDGGCKLSKVFKLDLTYELHFKRRLVGDNPEYVLRHRAMLDLIAGGKVADWAKLSLRERYQYTYLMPKSGIAASHSHHLRSRFKIEMAHDPIKWSPFASIETFINFKESFRVDEMRLAAGTAYHITKHHSISVGYLCDMKWEALTDLKATHIITTGYTYKF